MKKKLALLAFLFCIPLQACAFADEYYETDSAMHQQSPDIIYEPNYGWYGYWYDDVFYPAPADFVYSQGVPIYWGPFVIEPVVFYRVGFGYGYWCDGLWWPAPLGFSYYAGIHPYWGPVYVQGVYSYRTHYCGAYSSPGIHRRGYYVNHTGSHRYNGYRYPARPYYGSPYRSSPPVQRRPPQQYYAPQNHYRPQYNGHGGFRGGHR